MQRRSPSKHRHDGTSPLPLDTDWSPPPRKWNGRETAWPHDPRTGWSYCVTIPSWVVLPKSRDSDHVVPWILGVDFNAVRKDDERRGKMDIRPEVREFNDFIDSAELEDFQITGNKFTWFGSNEASQYSLIAQQRIFATDPGLYYFEVVFVGKTTIRERSKGGRKLRSQNNVLNFSSCPIDVSDFLQNLQVNRELMGVIESLKQKSEEENHKPTEELSDEQNDDSKEKTNLVSGDGESGYKTENVELEDESQNPPTDCEQEISSKRTK